MKEWRWYMSEDDGTWEILCNADCPEEDSDLKSANGREAVIGKKSKVSDYPCVSILPRAREDYRDHKVRQERQFYLTIEFLDCDLIYISQNSYGSEEVMRLARMFVGLKRDAALRVWKAQKLGELISRLDNNRKLRIEGSD